MCGNGFLQWIVNCYEYENRLCLERESEMSDKMSSDGWQPAGKVRTDEVI